MKTRPLRRTESYLTALSAMFAITLPGKAR